MCFDDKERCKNEDAGFGDPDHATASRCSSELLVQRVCINGARR